MKNLLLLTLFLSSFFSFSQEIKEIKSDGEEIPFAVIEQVPVYKGCNKNLSNSELKQCMSEKISKHVVKNFNTDIASSLGLPDGLVRVNVVFKITKTGEITGIRSRAPHPKLEEEAIRVIKLIPQMQSPGYVNEKPVIVPYSLPIMFNVENKKLSKKELRRLKKLKKK